MTTSTEKRSIDRLIPHFDAEYGEDWVWRVDPATLNMSRGSRCVFGQLHFPNYQEGVRRIKARAPRMNVDDLTANHTDYWRQKIINLRGERMNVQTTKESTAVECLHNALADIRSKSYRIDQFGTVNGIVATITEAISDLEGLS